MPLDLESLRNAVQALHRSLNVVRHDGSQQDDMREILRAGVIQNFKVAYERCWKFVQRWVKGNCILEEAEFPRTRHALFRMAARYGLIPDPLP